MAKELSANDIKVAERYIQTDNGVQSVLDIYPKKSYDAADIYFRRLYENVRFKELIDQAIQKSKESLNITHEGLSKDFLEIKERCMTAKPVMDYDKETKTYIQRVNEDGEHVWTFDPMPAIKAIENLGKHVGYYEKDNTQKQIKVGVERLFGSGDD